MEEGQFYGWFTAQLMYRYICLSNFFILLGFSQLTQFIFPVDSNRVVMAPLIMNEHEQLMFTNSNTSL